MPRLSLLALFALAACTGKGGGGPDGDDTGGADTGDTADQGPQPADLAPLSSKSCPDFSAPGTSTFTSSGEERQVTVLFPEERPADMPVYFFFHGVDDPSRTDNPGGYTADALGLQAVADDTQSIWVVPDAPVQNILGIMNVYLWDLAMETDHDLVLYDDLRTCVAQEFSADLHQVVAMGFSGGALFTTVVTVHRADTLATAVELSGGADIEAPGYESLLSAYSTPATSLPVLLTTGGETDVWPDPSFAIVDFEAASDTLQTQLTADGHFTVRCKDDNGHTITRKDWNLGLEWAQSHRFGEPSPYETDGLGNDDDWCVPTPAGGADSGA